MSKERLAELHESVFPNTRERETISLPLLPPHDVLLYRVAAAQQPKEKIVHCQQELLDHAEDPTLAPAELTLTGHPDDIAAVKKRYEQLDRLSRDPFAIIPEKLQGTILEVKRRREAIAHLKGRHRK